MTHDDSHFRFDTDALNVRPAEDLISQVIAVLRTRQPVRPEGPRMFVLNRLLDACISDARFDPADAVRDLLAHRISQEDVIDLYVPRTAEILGEQWLSDDLSFAQVTIGALRLQSVIKEVTPVLIPGVATLRTLVVLPEAEQHFLGAMVVTSQLERASCAAETSFCEPQSRVEDRIIIDRPDAVLFSCSRAASLATIAKTVQNIRNSVHPAPLFALGGPVVGLEDRVKKTTGVDIVTCDYMDVVQMCRDRSEAQPGQ